MGVYFKQFYKGLIPHRMFLLIAIIWGLIMIFIIGPLQIPDETNHFFRAYQVSQFKFMPEVKNNILGGELPSSFWILISNFSNIPYHAEEKLSFALIDSSLRVKVNPDETTFMLFSNTALYSPIPYIPQATGISIGKLFSLPPLILLYLGRLFNLALWIIMVYTAIKNYPH
ncbi:MAG: hypothetical protein A2W85_01745 [Bacteroidetes bacterium GWF2_41_31]|nr:MAG: hypothetical protein A2W85_01745 [Bacteroidetes bacterium GWF2_41_31]